MKEGQDLVWDSPAWDQEGHAAIQIYALSSLASRPPFTSRLNLSCDDYLEDKRENYQNWSVLCVCMTVVHTHMSSSYSWLLAFRFRFSVFRLHRSTMSVDAAYCYRPSSVVCRFVCHSSESCKNGWIDRDAIWAEHSGGPREPCIRWGSTSPMGRGNFEGGRGSPL